MRSATKFMSARRPAWKATPPSRSPSRWSRARSSAGTPPAALSAVSTRPGTPIVTWLASEQSAHVTGRVFEASGQVLAIAEGWVRGPRVAPVEDPTSIGSAVDELLGRARKNSGMDGTPGSWPQPKS